ncbi:MAG: hypothetical protein H6945_12565 [Zoogloeaceae bacterium]|nr:hypothetical protein [Rhodocyclaceae bacterium]MCP5236560.1 hypothetical protein [Zoogloeaceae bacterium]
MTPIARLIASALLWAGVSALAHAAPSVPTDDDTVVARLPARIAPARHGGRAASDPQAALQAAQDYLQAAREQGDARFAGLAIGALQAWRQPRRDPLDIVVMQATLAQHVHDFERAAELLQVAVSRAPDDAQAWLTLATVRRVQGRLPASDAACVRLAGAGQPVYAAACLAENRALRGDTGAARAAFRRLLAGNHEAALAAWLQVGMAQACELAGEPSAAEIHYRSALAVAPMPFAHLALADLLLDTGRPGAAEAVLSDMPESDAVLLRRAIAARALGRDDAAEQARRLAERFAAASARGDDGSHLRERARFALALAGDLREARRLARRNLERQREPADWLILARADAALGDQDSLRLTRAKMTDSGVRDARIEALR